MSLGESIPVFVVTEENNTFVFTGGEFTIPPGEYTPEMLGRAIAEHNVGLFVPLPFTTLAEVVAIEGEAELRQAPGVAEPTTLGEAMELVEKGSITFDLNFQPDADERERLVNAWASNLEKWSKPMTWGELKSWLSRQGVTSADIAGELDVENISTVEALEIEFENTPRGRLFSIRPAKRKSYGGTDPE